MTSTKTVAVSKEQLQAIYDYFKSASLDTENDCTFMSAEKPASADFETCFSTNDHASLKLDPKTSPLMINGVWYGSYEDTLALWNMAISQDRADGNFDGIIQSKDESFTVALKAPLATDNTAGIALYKNRIFYVKRVSIPGGEAQGNAWLIEEEKLANNLIRHWLVTTADVADSDDGQDLSWTTEITIEGQTKPIPLNLKLQGVDHIWNVGVLYFDSTESYGALPLDTVAFTTDSEEKPVLRVIGHQGHGVAMTPGVVNGKARFDELPLPLVQMDAVTLDENEGSPILNENGTVVGLCLAPSESGITIFTPAVYVQQIYTQIKTAKIAPHGYAVLTDDSTFLNTDALEAIGVTNYPFGLMVNSVPPGNPLYASFRAGDIILSYGVDKTKIPDEKNLNKVSFDLGQWANQDVPFEVLRDGKVEIIMGHIPPLSRQYYSTQWTDYGFILKEVDENYFRYFWDITMPAGSYLIIETYDQDGEFYYSAGIFRNINGISVRTIAEFQAALSTVETRALVFRYSKPTKTKPDVWSEEVLVHSNKNYRDKSE